MSQAIPKTGLSEIMRDWMSRRRKPFTRERLCRELGITTGKDREKVMGALYDFEKRGEIVRVPDEHNRRQYSYDPSWRKTQKESLLKPVILKAMYVSITFSLTDIQRLSNVSSRSYLDKIAKALRRKKLITMVARKPRLNGYGIENVYHIIDRERFRTELLD